MIWLITQWRPLFVALVASLILWCNGYSGLMIIPLFVGIGYFWSWGIMHNFATKAATRRADYTGGFYDITPEEAATVPDWIAAANMLFTMAIMILLITSLVLWVL